jgi:putative DNA primase/helicase
VTAVSIPEALLPLTTQPRWLVWQYELDRLGRRTKIPYLAHGRKASSTNPRTWRTYAELPLGNGFAGPGIVLGEGLQGVDLDACLSASGELEQWAAQIVDRLDTYTEVSPSGRGVKLLFYGPAGASAEVKFGEPVELAPGEHKRAEVALFTAGRYFTITGRVYRDRPVRTIGEGDAVWLREVIDELRAEEKARKDPHREPRQRGKRTQCQVKAPAMGATPSAVPPALLALIRDGVAEGQRSEQFHHAVRWCADLGMTPPVIVTLLQQYPNGIAAKYTGRVAAEVSRSLQGHQQRVGADAPVFTDDELAARFVAAHGHGYRWSPGLDWMRQAGHVWQRDAERTRVHAAREVCRDAADTLTKPKDQRTIASAKSVQAVLTLAQADPAIALPVEAWDRDRLVLNTPGGVVDLRTGAMRPHAPGDYMTQSTAVAPDFSMLPAVFMQFIGEVFEADEELMDFMQRALGYCLTGDRREQVLFFWHGTGANGKSTFVDLVRWVAGTYATTLPASELMVSRSERHPAGVATLRGRRLAISSELDEGQFWNEPLLKSLTGDDTLAARFMRQDFFEFELTHKHVIVGNHKPRLRGGDPAMARRLVLVPFEAKFSGAARDPSMLQRLKAEAPGVLAWLIRGAQQWHEQGLRIPDRVRAVSAEYLADNDDLALWLEECAERRGEAKASTLYASFRRWKEARGEHAPSQTAFGQRITALHGVSKRMSNGVRYAGLMLKEAERLRVEQPWR